LVVEDELLVALDIESILSEAGMDVVGPASSAGEALKLIADSPPDAALLDANLSGEPIDAVAQALSERGIPFAYVTGYGRESLPPAHPAPIVPSRSMPNSCLPPPAGCSPPKAGRTVRRKAGPAHG
jgi:CheY-like chemotaxis protein